MCSRLLISSSTTFLNVGGGRARAAHAPSLGYDHLDGGIGRLHTNSQILATLSKKVLIFFPKPRLKIVREKATERALFRL